MSEKIIFKKEKLCQGFLTQSLSFSLDVDDSPGVNKKVNPFPVFTMYVVNQILAKKTY